MDAVEALEALELLGVDQWGLVTTSQANENGISRLWLQRLSSRGVIQRLRHGVYALPSSRPGALQDVRAAWLYLTASAPFQSSVHGSDLVVSGASAASVHEIGDLVPPYIEFSTSQARMTKQSDLRLVRRGLPADDIYDLDGLPVTTVERTIYDLSAAATDLDHLTTLVVDAADRPDISIDRLAESLDTRAATEGHPNGRAMLQEMLATRGLNINSVGQKPDPYRQISQLITESLNPAILENLRASVSTMIKAQGLTGSNELAKVWGEIMEDRMPGVSAVTSNLLKTNKNSEHYNHDDEREEG